MNYIRRAGALPRAETAWALRAPMLRKRRNLPSLGAKHLLLSPVEICCHDRIYMTRRRREPGSIIGPAERHGRRERPRGPPSSSRETTVLNDPIQLIGLASLVGNSRETFHKSGTDGSNPVPSSEESSNYRFLLMTDVFASADGRRQTKLIARVE